MVCGVHLNIFLWCHVSGYLLMGYPSSITLHTEGILSHIHKGSELANSSVKSNQQSAVVPRWKETAWSASIVLAVYFFQLVHLTATVLMGPTNQYTKWRKEDFIQTHILISIANIFRVWIHRWQGPVTRSFDVNGWTKSHGAGDLRRHRAHYGVTVLMCDTIIIAGVYIQQLMENWIFRNSYIQC